MQFPEVLCNNVDWLEAAKNLTNEELVDKVMKIRIPKKKRISGLSGLLMASVLVRIIYRVSIILIEAGEVDLLSSFIIRIIRIFTMLMEKYPFL